MAGATRYPDAIRTDEFVVVVVSGIVHETIAIPFLARFLVEIRIRKESKTEHTRRLPVDCSIDACRFGLRLFVEPQAEFILLARRAESRFVHQPEHLEAFAARKFAVIEHLEQIHQTKTVLRDVIPKMLVASAPEVPGIAAHDFLRRKINAPSIGLKMSAVICGKSVVLFPAALASSIGSSFLQLANTSRAHRPTQDPTRLRRT